MDRQTYQEPLVARNYASKTMQYIFSDENKFQNWRKCWTVLAETQRIQGLDNIISKEAIDELITFQKKVNYDRAEEIEKETKHDVVAHVRAYGEQCPSAKGIIHLGATSMYVCDNTDLMNIKSGLKIIKTGLVNVISYLRDFADKYKDQVVVGYSHIQPASPTTLGKRATKYLFDLLEDLKTLEEFEPKIKARGIKSATGTQSSIMSLFDDNYEKVKEADKIVAIKLGFAEVYPVATQTYSRKIESKLSEVLAGIGTSLYKFGLDIRLMAHDNLLDEPFGKKQVGSSVMYHKKNPNKSERLNGFARKLMNMPINFYHTDSNQILERTLDDSSIRRMDIPQAFMLTDAILIQAKQILNGINVYPKQAEKQLREVLPFMVTEEILVKLVEKGEDRTEMHELLRRHAIESGRQIKVEGKDNPLFYLINEDSNIPLNKKELEEIINNPEKFAGAAKQQTEDFLKEHVNPVLDKYKNMIGEMTSEFEL